MTPSERNYVEIAMRWTGEGQTKTISILMTKEQGQGTINEKRSDLKGDIGVNVEDEDEKQPKLEEMRFRGQAARCNFLAQDKINIAFASSHREHGSGLDWMKKNEEVTI